MELLKRAYTKSIEEIKNFYKLSKDGLSSEEVSKREKIFGKNILKEEGINYLLLFFKQFTNILVYVLLVAALISAAASKWVDFFAIAFMILINSIIGFWQEVKAAISIKALKKLTTSKNRVIRDSKVMTISSNDLVPGDLLLLFEGSVVTADARLIESSSLVVDEATLTGESIPVIKDHTVVLEEKTPEYEQKNMVFAGTTVASGVAKAVVTRTGALTYFATIAKKAKVKSPDSPLTRSIKYFAKYYTILLVAVLSIIGAYGFFQGRDLLSISYILIAELVSAVPEGLPIVVTLVMVIGAISLSKKKTLIRHLPAVETLGSATIIATDKTGTITQGIINVEEVYASDMEKLKLVAALCNDSHGGKGDPIDVALSYWVEDFEGIRERYERIWSSGFDVKKRMMTISSEIDGERKVLMKGAFEELSKFTRDGKRVEEVKDRVDNFSRRGLRVLAFGIGEEKGSSFEIEIVGLIGFLDPPKKDVKMAIKCAKRASIKVIMMTGDYPMTAKAVSKDVGIYREGDLILTGENIDDLDDDELFKVLKKTTVLARISPDHKYRVVKVLQKNGEIVAVSGDGVNDVPALKAADLGIAMGSGTEAAKTVSKMVIADNNLSVIVDAIKNGRVIADNLRKVIYYLLSSSMQEIFLISFAIINGLSLPLFPIQILWVNLVTDGVQDKAFPFAKEEGTVMRRKPRKANRQFFDSYQVYRILLFGIVVGFASFELFKYLLKSYPYDVAVTITFTSVVMVQWFNGIHSQKEREPFFKNIKKSFTINPYIYGSIGIGIALQVVAVYLFPVIFHTTHMKLIYWRYPIYFSFFAFFVIEVAKWAELFIKKFRSS